MQEVADIEPWLRLFDLSDTFTQESKFCKFHCLILKRTDA